MLKPALPTNERERLAALRRFKILDTAPEAAFDDVVTLAAHICGTPVSMVSLVDAERQWFKAKVGVTTTETPRDISFCGHGILQSGLFIIPDAAQDERFADNPLVVGDPHVRFYAGAPLVTMEGEQLGMLCVVDRVPRELEAWQEDSLRVLARQVMAQVELRRRNELLAVTVRDLEEAQDALREANSQLHELATSDGLTGLKNHRVFQDTLKIEFSRSVRYHTDLSLIMLDVDHFKTYNDTYGHPAGDQVLKRVSAIIAGVVRNTDLAARYGGEEFAVILPNTASIGARELGERLRAAVEAEPWPKRPITISIGIATCTRATVSAPALVAESDTALYHSKMSGRNLTTHLADLAPGSEPALDPDPASMRKA